MGFIFYKQHSNRLDDNLFMNLCRSISQLGINLQDSANPIDRDVLFLHLSGNQSDTFRANQLEGRHVIFEVPHPNSAENSCAQTLINQASESPDIQISYSETVAALQSADSNHDHFVNSEEVSQFVHAQPASSRFRSEYYFRKAADYYSNILPNYLNTPDVALAANENIVDALQRRLNDYAAAWVNHPEANVFGLSLGLENRMDLLNRFEHDQNFPNEEAQVQPNERAAIHLLLRETSVTANGRLHLSDGAPFTPQEITLLSEMLCSTVQNHKTFLGLEIVQTNPSRNPHQITSSEMLSLAFPNTPSAGPLRALRQWMQTQRAPLTAALDGAQNEARHQKQMLSSSGNLLFMAGAVIYHRLLQPFVFQFHFNRSLLLSRPALSALSSYHAYVSPSRPEYVRRFLNHGSIHYLLLPLVLGPIIGGLSHALEPLLIPEAQRHNPAAHLALETALNYSIGIPLIEWICRSGRASMSQYMATPLKIVSRPQTLGILIRNPAFVLGWAGIAAAAGLSYLYLQHQARHRE